MLSSAELKIEIQQLVNSETELFFAQQWIQRQNRSPKVKKCSMILSKFGLIPLTQFQIHLTNCRSNKRIRNTKHLLDETESNITCCAKTNLMLDEVEFMKCFIIPQVPTNFRYNSIRVMMIQSLSFLFTSICLIIQIHELNHKTILGLTFKHLVACLGYLWPSTIYTLYT